jgi:trimeric autotransporter adhesin
MNLVLELVSGPKQLQCAKQRLTGVLPALALAFAFTNGVVPLSAQNATTMGSVPQTGVQISGLVGSGGMALPGATIVAVNANGAEDTTTTDVGGAYTLHLPAPGRYTIKVQMTAFAPVTREVTVTATAQPARADFQLVLLSRARSGPAQDNAARSWPTGRRSGGGGMAPVFEQPSSPGTAADQLVPQGMQVPGMNANSATESVAFSGNTTTGQFAGLSLAEMQQRMREMREDRSGFQTGGGPAPGGGMGPRIMIGGGGRRGFDINHVHGSLFYSIGDAALDAAPYSLTGQPSSKAGYVQNNFGVTLGGPLSVPKIYKGDGKTFFFGSFQGSRASDPYDAFSSVPTPAERNGDFSNTLVSSGAGRSPVVIINPQTGQPFAGNIVPASQISAAAKGLLTFIPLPNLPGTVQNFHFVTSATNNISNVNLRLMHSFDGLGMGRRRGGPRNNLTFGFHYQNSDTTLTNPFPSVGGSTSTQGFDVPVGYVRTFGRLTNILRVDYNRTRVSAQNLYAFSQNITGDLGINGVSQNPFDWGLPNLAFTNFAGVTDTNPELRRDQTITLSDFMVRRSGAHTLRWGGDFRRIQINTQADSNARGSFTFTGANTAQLINGVAVPGTGYDFADFLLGLPQLASVQFGIDSFHFRGDSWDLFAQDDWRLRGNLTLNLGLRYEYVSPLSEINDRLVNLDVNPNFTAVAPVLPGQTGPFTGKFPSTLINPDRNNFAPRVGIAWKAPKDVVVRAGYGINYNTTAYDTMAQQLAFQPPFSFTATNVTSPSLPLTLQNGFPTPAPATITNSYGVNRDYRLAYVQIWNLDVQREITPNLVVNIDYTGTKGTRLDIVEAPNQVGFALRIPGVQPFFWETSDGDSVMHAGSIRVRKRLEHGISIGGMYTFSKSMDNASTIGSGATVANASTLGGGSGGGFGAGGAGGGGTGSSAAISETTIVAQNAFDLAAERGLSSFDQQHRFTADYLWELPFGHDKAWLAAPGVLRVLLGDWQWSGDWTIASGYPFTARVLGDFADVGRGTNGSLRADLTGQPIPVSNPTTLEWFNTAAFTVPPPGQFGSAGRNTIEGPGSVVFDMAFTKLIPMGEARALEVRAQASNVFNTPQFVAIDTVVNSPTFGRVISTGPMRTVQFVARYRF